MDTQKFRSEDSINIIAEMLQASRHNMYTHYGIYLMWGYLVAISAIAHYILAYQLQVENAYYVWITMPIAGIIQFVYFYRHEKREKVKTYTDRVITAVWIGFLLALIAFFLSVPATGWSVVYPNFMVLYGLGTFVTGRILRFSPLTIGGLLSLVIAVFAYYQPFEIQLLLLALAISVSYIVPGHLLGKSQESK